MDKQIDIFVISQPSRFRNSICLLLASISQNQKILLADNIESAIKTEGVPTIVVVDADAETCHLSVTLKKAKNAWPQTELFVLVEDETQFQAAQAAGADVLLRKGFRTTKFIEAIESSILKIFKEKK